ncbi:MAG: DUF1844 domain-containing protein [Bacteroidetes bacterium]|nr:DUF1844 domain-containing protein [Bacteroidota bacterium]MBU1717587.1 DUF1844 domain-containing protein [Bacteroidota bacterium]
MEQNDQLFLQLLYVFHSSAMQAMGRVDNPATGKREKKLEQAKQSIEMLEMIREKTTGNISEQLLDLLNKFILGLKSTYLDETTKN